MSYPSILDEIFSSVCENDFSFESDACSILSEYAMSPSPSPSKTLAYTDIEKSFTEEDSGMSSDDGTEQHSFVASMRTRRTEGGPPRNPKHVCPKCGNIYAQVAGLLYHLNKSKSPCAVAQGSRMTLTSPNELGHTNIPGNLRPSSHGPLDWPQGLSLKKRKCVDKDDETGAESAFERRERRRKEAYSPNGHALSLPTGGPAAGQRECEWPEKMKGNVLFDRQASSTFPRDSRA